MMNNKKSLWHATRVKNLKKQRNDALEREAALHKYIHRLLTDMPFWLEQTIDKEMRTAIDRHIMMGEPTKQ